MEAQNETLQHVTQVKPVASTSKIWYLCDSAKNVECRKSSCVHNTDAEFRVCDRTSHIQYALLDGEGKPIIATAQPRLQVLPDALSPL